MLTARIVLVLGGLLATTTEALARCDTCVLWNGVLFWSGVLAFYLLLGIICCAEIALHGQGPRLIYVIFGCICAAILAALFYTTNTSYMLGAILIGAAANAVLFWAVMKTDKPV
jgi:hypothetical protein